MTREDIYNLIENIIPTFSVGQLTGTVIRDCAILRRSMDLPSIGNTLGFWNQWSIDIYTPQSPVQLDNIVVQLTQVLKDNGFEVQRTLSGDYYDPLLKAFSTSLTFREPKTI